MYNQYLNKLKQNKFIAIIMVIGTIIIAIVSFYDTLISVFNPIFSKEDNIIIDVKLASKNDPEVQDIMMEDYYWDFQYKENNVDDIIYIKPDLKYLKEYYVEKFVKVESKYIEIPSFNSPLPILDIKIINNSNQTIVLDNLILEISSSETDNRPLISMHTAEGHWDGLFKLFLVNEGWGEWSEIELNYNIHPNPSPRDEFNINNKEYNYSVKIPYFEKSKSIDLSKNLAKEGILFENSNLDYSAYLNDNSEIDSVGRFKYKEITELPDSIIIEGPISAIMEGEIVLKDINDEIIHKVNLSANIPLLMDDIGGGLEVFDSYDITLKNEGFNYILEHPISISLLPNEPERILLILKADKTSTHNFRLILKNINEIDIESKNINLDLFVPSSGYN